jgi:hypothetical protein
LALTKSVAPDNDRFMFKSDQKHIKMNLFWFNQCFSTKKTMKKVCNFYIFVFLLVVSRFKKYLSQWKMHDTNVQRIYSWLVFTAAVKPSFKWEDIYFTISVSAVIFSLLTPVF